MYLYSHSMRGFYHTEMHTTFPADAIKLSDEQYSELYQGQISGKTIELPDSTHKQLWLKEPDPPTPEDIRYAEMSRIKGELSDIDSNSIRPLRAILSSNYTEEDTNKLDELRTQAQELRDKLHELEAGWK